jgi:uncharacterized membrane protein YcaP (DUF421 family)
MESIIRAVMIYFFLLLVTRISGRRTMGEMTAFDFVLLLVIGEATQQGLLGQDFSTMNAYIVIATLVSLDIGLSLLKRASPTVEKWIDGLPTVLVKNGKEFSDRMKKARVDREDILEAARRSQGLASFDEIEHAVLERDGDISIVPKKPA